MYKVYINSLLMEVAVHCYAIFSNGLKLSSLTFADDITLLALQPSFQQTFMKICYQYGLKWRYECNNSKSGVVTFGDTKPIPSKLMHDRTWMLGNASVDELYEYENLVVIKNYAGSFSTYVDNIEKAHEKAGI